MHYLSNQMPFSFSFSGNLSTGMFLLLDRGSTSLVGIVCLCSIGYYFGVDKEERRLSFLCSLYTLIRGTNS